MPRVMDPVRKEVRIGVDHQAEIPDMVSSGPCPESVPEGAMALWCPSDAISDEKLRIGDDYQAVIPDFVSTEPSPDSQRREGMLLWSPSADIPDDKSVRIGDDYQAVIPDFVSTGVRIGDDYQAVIPDMVSTEPSPDSQDREGMLVWAPSADFPNDKLDEYIALTKEKYNYNEEQILGMLFWHKYDKDKANESLLNFEPFPDEWTVQDKELFEEAFQRYGKDFRKIRQMLPKKNPSSLMKYYYSRKNVRTGTSVMGQQIREHSSQKDDVKYELSGKKGCQKKNNRHAKSNSNLDCFNKLFSCNTEDPARIPIIWKSLLATDKIQ